MGVHQCRQINQGLTSGPIIKKVPVR